MRDARICRLFATAVISSAPLLAPAGLPDDHPYQALLTQIFFMFAQLGLTNTIFGLAIVHTTIQAEIDYAMATNEGDLW